MNNLEYQKIDSAEAENELINYAFSYEIINANENKFAIKIVDEIHNEEYTLGDFYQSYDEAYQAIKRFNIKLKEFYELSDEILAELTDNIIGR